MLKILHISHHSGCFKDQEYILQKLGFSVSNLRFPEGVYCVTHDFANKFWRDNCDYINAHDYVVVSDTSAIARCFFQNIEQLQAKLIIWICNRFDYAMWDQPEFYALFNQYKTHKKVRVIAYTLWEKIWCLKNGIDVMGCPVITPLGKSINSLSSETIDTHNISWKNDYTGESQPDVFIPKYTNDTDYFDTLACLTDLGISAYRGRFKGADDLKDFKCCLLSPDAMSKLFCFETIHSKIPVVLPSPKRLLELCKGPYLFNITGRGGGHLISEDLITFCEWYREDFKPVRFYYDSIKEIPEVIEGIDKDALSQKFVEISETHEKAVLAKWQHIYENF